MENTIINKVAQSGIITLNLEDFYPKENAVVFDLKPYLFMELILKEKDFREALKNIDWSVYSHKNIGITCSADAIIPLWAYMLVTTYLQPFANEIFFANEAELEGMILLKNLQNINRDEFEGKRVVVKGCGDITIPEAAYIEIAKLLTPVVKSIMFGEACSTVPIFKRK